ncbi:MAG: glycosyltransferase [Candidatus Puniceispirillum sp.]|nr:glycosyltransferase [Candidatus Pelagibacter sp.]MBA4283010.1 glycosyltransferase [Candidatus Puniceispirillum sp.]
MADKNTSISVSVVVPIYNEEDNIKLLLERLIPSLKKLGRSFEIIFVNDGSIDSSLNLLLEGQKENEGLIRILDFKKNYGQHMAIIAGFNHVNGETIITIDADLQNPPEEIYKLLEKIDEGYDYVGSFRSSRNDTFFRKYSSRLVNLVREKMTDIRMKDQGCMLRAYSKELIQNICESHNHSTYIPALAYTLSRKNTEVEVMHDQRASGESKYNLVRLIRLNFDIFTGTTILPLQLYTIFGLAICAMNGGLVTYLLIRRIIFGPEAQGLFTLFAVVFFLISVVILGIGLIGEYLGRLTLNLGLQPKYEIKSVYDYTKL